MTSRLLRACRKTWHGGHVTFAAPEARPPVAADRAPTHVRTTHHGHLWQLADGTPAHAPPGVMTSDGEGRLACHLCGRWFVHVGLHLRRHGWSPDHYREAVGLCRGTPLCGAGLSSRIAARQQAAWGQNADLRQHFATGQQMARTGQLAELARATLDDSQGRRSPATAARLRSLAAGRVTSATRRSAALEQLVLDLGAPDLATLIRTRYEAGASLEGLQRLTKMSREHLRAQLLHAGAELRGSGQNTPVAKHQRAANVDARVAAKIGTADIANWLQEQRAARRTLADLAATTGRSVPWVRSRLAGTTTTRH
jgi:hypothetical protein